MNRSGIARIRKKIRQKSNEAVSDTLIISEKSWKINMPSNERQIKSQMKVGAGFAVFGLVCPLYWMSLFSGNAGFETWVYGIHSCFFIAIGLVLLVKGWYDIKRIREKIECTSVTRC
jgi:hypothetical protein